MCLAFPKKDPMFPNMYVTGEHRTIGVLTLTLTLKKGILTLTVFLFPRYVLLQGNLFLRKKQNSRMFPERGT